MRRPLAAVVLLGAAFAASTSCARPTELVLDIRTNAPCERVRGAAVRMSRAPEGLPAADIVATRRDDPTTATRWRQVVREAMEDAFAQRFVATGVSRDHWYLFTPAQAPEEAR